VFRVYTDNKQDGGIVAMSAIPIAQWVSYYSTPTESDPYALAQTANAQPYDVEQFCWDVTYTYSTRPIDTGSIANPTAGTTPPGLGSSPSPPSSPTPPAEQSPSVRPWQIHFGVDNVQQAAPSVDRIGQNVRASNGQPYTGLQYDVALPYFELTIPRLTADRSKRAFYMNTTNNDNFFGYLPGSLRVGDYDIQTQFEQQWGYYYEIKLKFYERDAHTTKVLDEGSYWKDGVDLKKNADKWSNPIDGSVLLDGFGGKLADGAAPVTKTFWFYQSTTFANIL
jgi:hypothetical protein